MKTTCCRVWTFLAVVLLSRDLSGAADFSKVDARMAAGDAAGAAALLREITSAEPKNRQAWVRLGNLELSRKAWAEAAEALEAAMAISPDPRSQYNAACARARLGQGDAAFKWLDQVAAAGAFAPDVLRADEDLASLRADARWPRMLEKAADTFEPCRKQPESRHFDFWLGEWRVRPMNAPPSAKAGDSRITKILGGCVLLEEWTGTNGWTGKSFNIWDQVEKAWVQTWVDQSGGQVRFFDGKLKDDVLSFRTAESTFGGKTGTRRLSFHDLKGKVRQHSELSTDGGKTWTTEYDFLYEPKR